MSRVTDVAVDGAGGRRLWADLSVNLKIMITVAASEQPYRSEFEADLAQRVHGAGATRTTSSPTSGA